MKRDKSIDAYIAKSEIFAKPILASIRATIHKNCPDVEETMKWNHPHFLYNGSILGGVASFKNHCAFGFWLGALMPDLKKINKAGISAMGQFGRIESLKDLPSDKHFASYIKLAMKLTDAGAKAPSRIRSEKPKELIIPDYFLNEIRKNKKAQKTFETFPYSHKKDYVEWITEAMTDETRKRRMATALEWMEEGKDRNWKYR